MKENSTKRGIFSKTGKAVLLGSLLLLSTVSQAGKTAHPDKLAVVPGKSIGQVHLNERSNTVTRHLGNSDYGDGAMGHLWETWEAHTAPPRNGEHYELDVYSARNQTDAFSVRTVRVNSPQFHTAEGIACGSTLAQIQKRYPKVQRVARYLSPQVSKPVVIFDAVSRGIAFEVVCDKDGKARSTSPCVALTVHKAGNGVLSEYYPLTTYQVEKPGIWEYREKNPTRGKAPHSPKLKR